MQVPLHLPTLERIKYSAGYLTARVKVGQDRQIRRLAAHDLGPGVVGQDGEGAGARRLGGEEGAVPFESGQGREELSGGDVAGGYGVTIGNALRRILLSSLEGAFFCVEAVRRHHTRIEDWGTLSNFWVEFLEDQQVLEKYVNINTLHACDFAEAMLAILSKRAARDRLPIKLITKSIFKNCYIPTIFVILSFLSKVL